MVERVLTEDRRVTVACPECDSPQVWFRRESGRPLDDAPTAFRCSDCGGHFDEAIVRPRQGRHHAKYAGLSPEDVGL